MNLYDMTEEVKALVGALESDSEDVSAALDAYLHSEDTVNALDRYCALMREYSARAEMRHAEAERIQSLARADEKRAERMAERLKAFLEAAGREKIETPRFSVALRKNGGLPPVVLDVPPDELPGEYVRIILQPDKSAIARALQSGIHVPGARLLPHGTHLEVK